MGLRAKPKISNRDGNSSRAKSENKAGMILRLARSPDAPATTIARGLFVLKLILVLWRYVRDNDYSADRQNIRIGYKIVVGVIYAAPKITVAVKPARQRRERVALPDYILYVAYAGWRHRCRSIR